MKNLNLFFLLVIVSSCAPQVVETISPEAFDEKYNHETNGVLLDLRTKSELDKTGSIAESIHLDFHSPRFNDSLSDLDKSKTYFLYCASGQRSAKTAMMMKGKGFKKIFNLEGGIMQWEKEGKPLVLRNQGK